MQQESILILAGACDFYEKVMRMPDIDPSNGGGIDYIEFSGITLTENSSPEPLIAKGFEELHAIDDGFCVHFADAMITDRWRISTKSNTNYLRFRIAFSGTAKFKVSGIAENVADPESVCTYTVQPAGARLQANYRGGESYKYCTLSISEDFLRNRLGLTEADLPRALLSHWQNEQSVFGQFEISHSARAAALAFFNIKSRGTWRKLEIRNRALELMRLLFQAWQAPDQKPVVSMKLRPSERSKLFELRDWLTTIPETLPSMQALSQKTGLNRNKLHFGFKRLFGMSVHEYYTDIRMKKAQKLLRESKMSIADIGYAVGYSEPTNFTSAFKKHFSQTPRQARRILN